MDQEIIPIEEEVLPAVDGLHEGCRHSLDLGRREQVPDLDLLLHGFQVGLKISLN